MANAKTLKQNVNRLRTRLETSRRVNLALAKQNQQLADWINGAKLVIADLTAEVEKSQKSD